MSEERRKKKAAREATNEPKPFPWRKVGIALLIIAAFGGAYYLGFHRRASRLDAFAQCVSSKGAKMYGAYWCPHCAEQKELFGSAFDFVNYVECGVKGDAKAQSPACQSAGVKHYPTWEFADRTRIEGKETLESLSDRTGCSLP